METEPSFSIPVVHSPAPASGSVLCTGPLAFCCFGPFSRSSSDPSSQPLSQDCSRAPGFLSYHSVCFHGVTIQINSIIIKINKDFFLQTRKALSDLVPPGTEEERGTPGMRLGAWPWERPVFSCQLVMGGFKPSGKIHNPFLQAGLLHPALRAASGAGQPPWRLQQVTPKAAGAGWAFHSVVCKSEAIVVWPH